MRSKFSSLLQPGRPKLALIIATVLIWLLVGALFRSYGYERTWKLWGIPTLSPYFMDLREIPAMVQARHLGLDPASANPLDPMHRAFNYPAVWYLLTYTNLSQADTLWLGILLLLLFFAGVFLFPRLRRTSDVLLLLLVIFSPAAMLLYERANVDLFIFFLGAAALSLSEISTSAAVVSMEFAALLKFYPLFGLTLFLSRGRRAFLWILAGSAALFAFYLAIASRNFHSAWSMTPRGTYYAYGALVFPLHFFATQPAGGSELALVSTVQPPLMIAIVVSVELAFVAALVFWRFGIRDRERLTSSSQRNLNAFWLGACVYIGTFLLGNNWDYRLVFLAFAVPQLSEWTRGSGGRQAAARVTLGLLLLSCWYMFYKQLFPVTAQDVAFILDEAANWSLCAGLTYFVAASVPEPIREMLVRRPKSKLQAA